MGPKVSFIIPAFNEQLFIIECVESCLNQTYKGNIEVCVTDDGSTDDTFQILQEAFSNNPLVKLHRFEKNRGKVPAFNKSFEMATGDYILPMGADDICCSNRVELQVNAIEDSGKMLVWSDLEIVDENGDPTSATIYIEKEVSKERIIEDNFVPGGTACMTRTFAMTVFPIPEQLRFEDWWIGFNAVIDDVHKFVNGSVIKYRMHANNTVGHGRAEYALTRRKNIRRHFAYYDEFEKILENRGELLLLKKVKYCSLYKHACMSDSLFERLKFWAQSLRYFSFRFYKTGIKFSLVVILGLKGIEKLKRFLSRA